LEAFYCLSMNVYVVGAFYGTIRAALTENVLAVVVNCVSANSKSPLGGELPPGERCGVTSVFIMLRSKTHPRCCSLQDRMLQRLLFGEAME
jgi:hypothetical protein